MQNHPDLDINSIGLHWESEISAFLKNQSQLKNKTTINIGIMGALGGKDIGDYAMLVANITRLNKLCNKPNLIIFSWDIDVVNNYLNIQTTESLHSYLLMRNTKITPCINFIKKCESRMSIYMNRILHISRIYLNDWFLRFIAVLRSLLLIYNAYRLKKGQGYISIGNEGKTIIRNLHSLDLLFFNGGAYLNSWHVKSVMYPFLAACIMCRIFNIPYMASGLNIGPLNWFDRQLIKISIGNANLIGLRDWEESKDELTGTSSAKNNSIFFSFDDAAFLDTYIHKKDANSLEKSTFNTPYAIIQIHRWLLSRHQLNKLTEEFIKYIDWLKTYKRINIRLLSMTLGIESNDYFYLQKIKDLRPDDNHIQLLPPDLQPQTIMYIISKSSLLISSRHHPFLFGITSNTPSIAIAYDRYYEQKLKGVIINDTIKATIINLSSLNQKALIDSSKEFLLSRN